MPLLQKAPETPEEIAASKPLDVSPEEVLSFDEAEWYAKAYRGDAPQLTLRALVMGAVLGFFLSFTNLYIGLKTGLFLGVAITASLVSFTFSSFAAKIRLARSPLSILENACMASTASSAGYATGNALISAFPAMLLLSANASNGGRGVPMPWWVMASWVLCLAALGVVMAIPMKRGMINRERLKFPSGTAAAVLLQSLYSQAEGALAKGRALLVATLAGGTLAALRDLAIVRGTAPDGSPLRQGLLPEQSSPFDGRLQIVAAGKPWPLSAWNVKLDHSLLLVAAGALIGLRATVSMVAGGLLLVLYVGPHGMEATWTDPAGAVVAAVTSPETAWRDIGLWFGAPLMVSYGLVSFATQWRTIGRAVSSLGTRGGATSPAARAEVPMRWFVWGTAVCGLAAVFLAWRFFAIPIHLGLLAVGMAFFMSLVASRANGETDFIPTGPMGKIVQLAYGVLIPQSYAANLMTASLTGSAGVASADLLNDLKCGYLLGAHPRRQFVAQLAGVFVGTAGSVLAYDVLVPDATALTGQGGHDPAFAAPAAQQWMAVAKLFQVGIENLHPLARHGILWGLGWGAVLAVAEALFPKQRRFMPSATGWGLGMLLPFYYPLALFVGAAAAAVFAKASPSRAERFGVPIASGLIAGESVVGVAVRILNHLVFK